MEKKHLALLCFLFLPSLVPGGIPGMPTGGGVPPENPASPPSSAGTNAAQQQLMQQMLQMFAGGGVGGGGSATVHTDTCKLITFIFFFLSKL